MKKKTRSTTLLSIILFTSPLTASAVPLTPGQYEYTIKMNMPGAPSLPPRTAQRCLTANDLTGNKLFEVLPNSNGDCQTKDVVESAGQFSYKVSCNKPQKVDGDVKGTYTATGMTMDVTMSMSNAPGPITQSIVAQRVGDCTP